MPSPRSAQELLRLLHAVETPIYAVGEDRQIVFVNKACAKWLGVEASDLQGRVCRYQSGDANPLAAAADALCPPPEVFHGNRICGTINGRRAEFMPLGNGDGSAIAVLTIVDSTDAATTVANHDDEASQLHLLVERFRTEMAGRHRLERLAGNTPVMQRVRVQVEMAAKSRQAVLIVGPAGSGKQHVAHTIHFAGAKPIGAIVPISCSALPAEVLHSTLGTLSTKHATARDEPPATLLLTDLQAMPVEAQPEVAQWLWAGAKNLRIIATATMPLSSFVERGAFRDDLAMLLSTLVIELPSLSARKPDIPLLAQMLLEDCNAESEIKQLRGFTADAMDRVVAYDWPGEIDELAKMVHEAFATAESYEITAANLPKKLHLAAEAARFPRKSVESIDLEKFLAQVETELIDRAMKQAKGNKSQAAKLLGLTRPRLYRRMVQLGLAGEEEDETI
jgi:DNA-binding NtrC family response regulator